MQRIDSQRSRVQKRSPTYMCFNEEYVSQFVFKPDELLTNSFDIFVRTDSYKQKEQEIENLVRNIKTLFIGNEELENLIATLKEMGNSFKLINLVYPNHQLE